MLLAEFHWELHQLDKHCQQKTWVKGQLDTWVKVTPDLYDSIVVIMKKLFWLLFLGCIFESFKHLTPFSFHGNFKSLHF